MKTRITSLARQQGSAYMTVVITAIVVGAMLVAYLKMITVQNQFTMRSQAWNRTVPVLEAGVEEALAHLNQNAAPDSGGSFNLNLASDGWQAAPGGGWYKIGQIGDDYYYTKISSFSPGANGYYPFITSTGYVAQVPTLSMMPRWQSGPLMAAVSIEQLITSGYTRRTVLCSTTNVPTFTKALVAKRGITMNGQNVRTDSFDSGDPLYNDGFGHYTNNPSSKWKTNGDIASNDTITNTVAIGNANIYGKVATGPYGTIGLNSGGYVGDKTFQGDPANGGKIQKGWSSDDMNMEFPSVNVPTNLYAATPPSGSSFTTNGVTYNTVLGVRGNRYDYDMQGQTLSGNVYVSGTVRLLVRAGINMSGQDRITLEPGAYLYLYADCASSSLGGNGVQNPGTAEHFYYFGTDKNTSLSYGGNAAFTAVFYAPNADMQLGGGGNSTIDFSGSAIAKTIKITGNFNFHYDENLKRVGLYSGYILTSWDEMLAR